jgi:hypothetical protein
VAQSGRLLGEVVSLGGVARLGRRAGVVLGGDAGVSGLLVQAGTHRVEPVMVAEPRRKLLDGAQPGERAVDLADRDRTAITRVMRVPIRSWGRTAAAGVAVFALLPCCRGAR